MTSVLPAAAHGGDRVLDFAPNSRGWAGKTMLAGVDRTVETGKGPWHRHDQHQLVMHVTGTFRLEADGRSWLIAPGTGVWVPAGTMHRTVGAGFRSAWALLDVGGCPPLWTQLSPITVSPLLRHLFSHLQDELADCDRENAERVVLDLLHPLLALPSIGLPLPRDPRCEQIVATVLDDPANSWELADWAVEVGASPRTLSRIFQAETAMSFSQWRTHARIRAAINELAAGRAVAQVARAVGYETTSAFVTAFRRCTGRTPTTFFPPGHLSHADDMAPILSGAG